MRSAALTAQVRAPTHRVKALGTSLYPAPDIKASPWLPISMNALLCVAELGQTFTKLADGSFVPTRHIVEIDRFAPDFVAVAERFVGVPYLWGGRSRLGLDCSGLVQVALQAAGIECPRDSDMQQAELGDAVDGERGPRRAAARRPDILEGSRRHHARRLPHAACQRASHGRRGGAAARVRPTASRARGAASRRSSGCRARPWHQRLRTPAPAVDGGRHRAHWWPRKTPRNACLRLASEKGSKRSTMT